MLGDILETYYWHLSNISNRYLSIQFYHSWMDLNILFFSLLFMMNFHFYCDIYTFLLLSVAVSGQLQSCVLIYKWSVAKLCPTLWPPGTVALQAPLSMGFPRQEYQSGLPFPSPEDLPYPGIEPVSLVSPVLAGRFYIDYIYITHTQANTFFHLFISTCPLLNHFRYHSCNSNILFC